MSDEYEDGDIIQFQITFSTDRDHFFRRTCPSCGRDFKTEIDEVDLASSLHYAFRHMGLEIGGEVSASNEEASLEYLYCPYCECRTESSNMFTQTFFFYLQRYAMREYVLPKVNKMFSNLTDAFGKGQRRSGGFISMEVKFENHQPILPPRPISGPEPPDMTIIELLCCGKRIKVLDNWRALKLCPYCGTKVRLQ